MRGTYLYVCDPKLKEYLSKYIEKYSPDNTGITYSVAENEENYTMIIAEEGEEYKCE